MISVVPAHLLHGHTLTGTTQPVHINKFIQKNDRLYLSDGIHDKFHINVIAVFIDLPPHLSGKLRPDRHGMHLDKGFVRNILKPVFFSINNLRKRIPILDLFFSIHLINPVIIAPDNICPFRFKAVHQPAESIPFYPVITVQDLHILTGCHHKTCVDR